MEPPELRFYPGSDAPSPVGFPLARYLPPLPPGMAAAWLVENVPPGSWLFDPLGASPALTLEAARAGYYVLVASNNPILSFITETLARAPRSADFQSALADLAMEKRGDERLQTHLQSLYLTVCDSCAEPVQAQAFIWRKDEPQPFARVYDCPKCGQSGEHPIAPPDLERLKALGGDKFQRARALQRVILNEEAHRADVEEALENYLPRALYGLFTLANKLEGLGLPPERARLLQALLISTFDQCNSLWPWPGGRSRPKQLSVPPQFRENNLWMALEDAVKEWTQPGSPLPVTRWPELPPEGAGGGICLFRGRVKALMPLPETMRLGAVLTVFPRPNQAFWTLSALWSGWLWGAEAALPLLNVLDRRRYDWNWHTTAIHSALAAVAGASAGRQAVLAPLDAAGTASRPSAPLDAAGTASRPSAPLDAAGTASRPSAPLDAAGNIAAQTPFFGLLPELAPGFLSAVVTASSAAGFALEGLALRGEQELAQGLWRPAGRLPIPSRGPVPEMPFPDAEKLDSAARAAIRSDLRSRNEPAPYLTLYAAGLAGMAQAGALPRGLSSIPADLLNRVQAGLARAFADRSLLKVVGPADEERGTWWLAQTPAPPDAPGDLPLADQVEMEVVRFLQKQPAFPFTALDHHICAQFPGLRTPPVGLIRACLESYGEPLQPAPAGSPAAQITWRMRQNETATVRKADLQDARALLARIGQQMGYAINTRNNALTWETNGAPVWWFYLMASSIFSRYVYTAPPEHAGGQRALVIPGSRAQLVRYKLRHDPRLAAAAATAVGKPETQSGPFPAWRFIKFRHLRDIASRADLSPITWEALLNEDPLTDEATQMQLFGDMKP